MDVPIFAFTRSREVVVEVSRAGGMGVLGAIAMSPEELERDLSWIDERIGGKPYGVDTVMPMSYEGRGEELSKASLAALIPQAQHDFVEDVLGEHGVGPLPEGHETHESLLAWSVEKGMQHVEVSLRHPIALLANALGTPPPECIDMAHERGVKVAALCGKKKQALSHKRGGVDIIVAQGWEAGGHTGEIAGMILCPEIVDAVGDTPVVMAGGIGCGRQMAAALSLGAEGVWTGSIWLTVAENSGYHPDAVTDKLLSAGSGDTVRSRCLSGKPARQLKTEWTELWDGPRSPGTLPIPLQWMVQAEAVERIYHHECDALMGSPVGQIVGRMNEVKTTAEVMAALVSECRASVARVHGVVA
jgi:NAD(P)H-dependent flavin oxidoreductase YrpB (nitropropane dioxygenase family)